MNSNLNKITEAANFKEEDEQRRLTLCEIPETGELEIQKQATDEHPAKKIRFPKDSIEQHKLPPEQFANVQNALEEQRREDRELRVYANSIESRIGYDSLIRLLGEHFGRQIAYFRSEQGGSLSLKEARKRAYQRKYDEAEAAELLNELLTVPSNRISFENLSALHGNSAAMAENLWEMMKREARREFESGHRAAAAFEPVDYMKNAWDRASYLGLRESFCEEWQPKGGIELSMIDVIVQAFQELQFWTTESVLRSRTRPRQEDYETRNQKKLENEQKRQQLEKEYWDIELVSEQEAIEHAARMADRCQRMYFRALRSLRDWRRYTPQVTINNAKQVNIATDGGQQINMSSQDSSNAIKS